MSCHGLAVTHTVLSLFGLFNLVYEAQSGMMSFWKQAPVDNGNKTV